MAVRAAMTAVEIVPSVPNAIVLRVSAAAMTDKIAMPKVWATVLTGVVTATSARANADHLARCRALQLVLTGMSLPNKVW